ncbi:MAG: ABC transporter [Sphingobium sp.]
MGRGWGPSIVRPFLLFWLSGLALLIAGLPALLRTGQADPRSWTPFALLILGAAAYVACAPRSFIIGRPPLRSMVKGAWLAGSAGVVPLLCWLAAGRSPAIWPVILLLSPVLLGVCAAMLFRARRLLAAVLCLAAALTLWRVGEARPLASETTSPAKLAVITALPLFWREGPTLPGNRVDAPIIGLLRLRFDVRPLDSPLDPALARIDRLLIAQPRAMAPEALVAIDDWVRRGGRAVILADPLLRWPSPLPVGDRRRAPPASALTPLLAHWGLYFGESPTMDERRLPVRGGAVMTLLGTAPLVIRGTGCTRFADGFAARCAIGRGTVTVVADADMIDDRLWLADPADPRDPRQWSADTPALIAAWLGATLPGDRRWVRSAADLEKGVRLAVLAGLFWAALGALLLHARPIGFRSGPTRLRPKSNE